MILNLINSNISANDFELNLSFSLSVNKLSSFRSQGKNPIKDAIFENETCKEADFFIDIFRDWKKTLAKH